MTRQPRKRPKYLANKLLRIRQALGITQTDLSKRIKVDQKRISSYESGDREPDLLTIIKYSDLANVCTDILIRDELHLPENIPTRTKEHFH
jgi:transcriptional regulator with XRE-family HTH domain